LLVAGVGATLKSRTTRTAAINDLPDTLGFNKRV